MKKRTLLTNELTHSAKKGRHLHFNTTENCESYLKSGMLKEAFKIQLLSVNNLIRCLDDQLMTAGQIIDIQEYKYLDTQYEIKYGYDLETDNEEGRVEHKRREKLEARDIKREEETYNFLNQAHQNFNNKAQNMMDR